MLIPFERMKTKRKKKLVYNFFGLRKQMNTTNDNTIYILPDLNHELSSMYAYEGLEQYYLILEG